ncbi:MAG: hypothetical protein AAF747_06075 [Planctomycetota bacterium]
MRIKASDIITEIGWGDADAHYWDDLDKQWLVKTWREMHYAAQAVAEFGKSWGAPRDDDSHSALVEAGTLGKFMSVGAKPGETAAWEWHQNIITIRSEAPNGTDVRADVNLNGRTLEAVISDVRAAAERLIGPARQPSKPAPDLPDHPVGQGEIFDAVRKELDPEAWHGPFQATVTLADLYHGTVAQLKYLQHVFADVVRDGAHEAVPRVWPHHFDLASLFVLERDSDGEMTKTVGIGLTPPDDVSPWGYWYVSPWASSDAANDFSKADLSHGRWHERGSMPMAILPVEDFMADCHDPDDDTEASRHHGRVPFFQSCMVAEFIADAWNACFAALRPQK